MIVLAFLVIVGVVFLLIDLKYLVAEALSISGFILLFLAGIMLFVIPFTRMDAQNFLIQRDALQSTYTNLRSHPLEMAAIAGKIADYNATLAQYQYWSHTEWKLWIPSDVNKTQPIR